MLDKGGKRIYKSIMAKSIQFQGRENLVQGFRNTKAKGWSVWDDRDMLTKGIGEEMLDQFLQALEEGSTNTIYKLRIYEDITDAKLIKMGTDPDGSFKFILEGDPDQITHPIYSQRNNSNRLFQRLEQIEVTQAALLAKINGTTEEGDDDDEPEEPETIGAMVVDIIKNPVKLRELAESINMVRSMFNPVSAQLPAAIGNIPVPSQKTVNPVTDAEKIKRAQDAITILDSLDPNFLDHIETLAKIAKRKDGQFDLLLSMLDNMK